MTAFGLVMLGTLVLLVVFVYFFLLFVFMSESSGFSLFLIKIFLSFTSSNEY